MTAKKPASRKKTLADPGVETCANCYFAPPVRDGELLCWGTPPTPGVEPELGFVQVRRGWPVLPTMPACAFFRLRGRS